MPSDLIRGWRPVRVRKTRRIKIWSPVPIPSERALERVVTWLERICLGWRLDRRARRAFTRRAEEWVARCTAPGLKGDRAARRPCGASWRDQTSHIPLRMRLRLPSINGCRYDCQFPRYISREIAAAGCRKFRPRAPIFAAGRPPSSDPRRSGGIPAPWPRRRAIATGRTGAPSPAPWCRRRDRSGDPGSC